MLESESEIRKNCVHTKAFACFRECQQLHAITDCITPSLSLRHHAHIPLAKHLMHMVHLSGNTSVVLKSSSDWLNYTGFPGDVCAAFFNVPPGNKDAMAPNPLTKEERRHCLQM